MTELLPGDIVARRKGPVLHKGLVMPDGRILHNTPQRGEHLSSLAEFAAGRPVRVVERVGDDGRDWSHGVANRAGRRYNLFVNNCEHTVSRVARGRAESPQLRSWIAGVGLAAVTFALTRHPGATAAGFAFGRRVLARSGFRG